MVFKKKVKRRRYTKKAKRIYRKSGVPGYITAGLGILILRRAVPKVPYLNQLPAGLSVPVGMVIVSKFGGKSIPRGVGAVGKALAVSAIAESVIGGNIPMLSGSSTNTGAW